jgi:hypothetical protein
MAPSPGGPGSYRRPSRRVYTMTNHREQDRIDIEHLRMLLETNAK